jgi:hypothetical protein
VSQREHIAVCGDVRDGYLIAETDYGVAIHNGAVDRARAEAL